MYVLHVILLCNVMESKEKGTESRTAKLGLIATLPISVPLVQRQYTWFPLSEIEIIITITLQDWCKNETTVCAQCSSYYSC